ncbi:MAG: sugar transferase [Acidobacteriaceae bacterium]
MSTEFYLPQISKQAALNGSPLANKDSWRSDSGKIVGIDAWGHQSSAWCSSAWKRVFDLACVTPALVLLSPLLGVVALAVRLTSPGPVIFRQQRAGRHRKLFTIYKFRTMVKNSELIGPRHTAKGDPRITPIGNFLRRFKLDELPQLYNVFCGDMSLVGPRPKLPDHEQTRMATRPGVTGAATLAFREEQHILCEVPPERLESFYRDHVIPLKINLDTEYMRRATLLTDIGMLLATLSPCGSCLTHRDLLVRSNSYTQATSPHAFMAAEPTGD